MDLSKEQLLLLNNLLYTHEEEFPGDIYDFSGKTVRQFVESIDYKVLEKKSSCGAFMTGEDYIKIFNAVKNDPELLDMQIAATHIDDGPNSGGGFSAVFIDQNSKEAVVTFKGTGPDEWPDNFDGATFTQMTDSVSTQHQTNALDWYKNVSDELNLDQYEIIVTGHSKGGNKAKYITVLDDSVDHCVSFDGQGFSDEFFDKYESLIAENQHKIENHNANYDPVNGLLNDIGERYWYEAYDIDNGNGGFMEHHCPNSFMQINEAGRVSMNEVPQPAMIRVLDTYLNGIMRSTDNNDLKRSTADLVGEIVVGALSKKGTEFYIDLILSPENSEEVTHILAYTLEYVEALPAVVADEFTSIPGLSEFFVITNKITNLDNDILNTIRSVVAKGLDMNYDITCKIVKDIFGIDIKNQAIDSILAIMSNLQPARNKININDYKDRVIRTVSDFAGGRGNADFTVNINVLNECTEEMQSVAAVLSRVAAETESCKMSYTMGFLFNRRISQHAAKIRKSQTIFEKSKQVLENITGIYKNSESKLCSEIGK